MKIKKSMFCLLAVSMLALTGCGQTSSVSSVTDTSSEPSSSVNDPHTVDDLSTKQTLSMNVFYNSATTMMKFGAKIGSGSSYEAADGNTYTAGDFKPVWKQVQKNLNFTINDVTDSSKSSVSDQFTTLQGNGFKSSDGTFVNIAQGNSDQIIKEGTTNSTILDLSKYLDVLPNFKAYLDANPVISKQIVDANGAMYYAPYFDGSDDMEKSLLLRKDWVEKLLDGDYTESEYDTGVTINSQYTRYNAEEVDQDMDILGTDGKKATMHKKYTSKNDIITLQNALAVKDGKHLVKALRDYIDATYANAYGTKRSELFVGGKACYNIDELVALYRCVKASPYKLTGDATKDIVPLMPRQSKNTRGMDLHNFMQYFGCRGLNSRSTYFYVNDNEIVSDIRDEDNFISALGKMNEMYKEGLILQNFSTKTADGGTDGNFSNNLFKANRGFSEYDYVQTQTILNAGDNMELIPVYPAAYAWKDGVESRFTESWRSVKTQGWFITADTANDVGKLKRALYLFDYFWGKEGSTLMSYGPSAWVDGTTTYKGKSVPKLSAACLNELKTLADGNYTNYYRQFLGGTFPIGYVKEQGMEYQTVDATAKPYLDIVENALEAGIINHPNFKVDNTDHMQDLFPTTLSYTSGEQDSISKNYSAITTVFYTNDKGTNLISNIIMKGFEGADTTNFTSAREYLNYVDVTLKIPGNLQLVQRAYDRMGL